MPVFCARLLVQAASRPQAGETDAFMPSMRAELDYKQFSDDWPALSRINNCPLSRANMRVTAVVAA
ncbi:hypothetical protein DY251_20930 [Mesorhizobium denitrificans]|uniref:Uncharacterized protein n=1 Tax=Mesorhizobium denitrificans TaxID=2294114 RepID=A0A371X1Z7_9HYPH|nr:hypothetical protein DY251_20930 [Mesorhizobium denitrificans]